METDEGSSEAKEQKEKLKEKEKALVSENITYSCS